MIVPANPRSSLLSAALRNVDQTSKLRLDPASTILRQVWSSVICAHFRNCCQRSSLWLSNRESVIGLRPPTTDDDYCMRESKLSCVSSTVAKQRRLSNRCNLNSLLPSRSASRVSPGIDGKTRQRASAHCRGNQSASHVGFALGKSALPVGCICSHCSSN